MLSRCALNQLSKLVTSRDVWVFLDVWIAKRCYLEMKCYTQQHKKRNIDAFGIER